MRKRQWVELAIIIALAGLALSVRLYRLDVIPIGLYSDEAANGVDALEIIAGRHPIFFERNNGREPLFIYLQALSVALLGATPFALRLVSAIVGALTVPAVYWMSRESFFEMEPRPRILAAWTALFVAFSYWHITLSRTGFRAIMLPLLTSLTFAWFWRAWRHLKAGDRFPWGALVLCGIALGTTLYTYVAARFVPVVVFLVALAAFVQSRQQPEYRRQVLRSFLVISVTALVVFLPLAIYFATHASSFIEHSAANSVFAELTRTTTSLPVGLADHILRTVGMFGWVADRNWRFNPAGRPAVDLVSSAWVFAGVVLAVWRRRYLPYLFAVTWLAVLALPGLLSDAAPHSLRMLGVVPAVYLLAVLAMLHIGRRLAGRRTWLAAWLPLPFLIFSGVTGLRDYYTAWQRDNVSLREAFDTDFVEASRIVLQDTRSDSQWLIPVRTVFSEPRPGYVFEFLTRGKVSVETIKANENQAPDELRQATAGKRFAHLLRWDNVGLVSDGSYAIVDNKGLLAFLLGKHGQLVADQSQGDIGFATYQVPDSPDYQLVSHIMPADISFGGQMKLIGVAYGHTATSRDEPAAALDNKRLPSGHSAWGVLRWEAQQAVENKFKTSLFLTDEAGHLAGQVDNPLLSDLYLFKSNWETGEQGNTYHILPTLPGIPPGRYQLRLAVYDPKTMQRLPVLYASGVSTGTAAFLGYVDITPAITAPQVQPSNLVPPNAMLASDLSLLGYDLPMRAMAPGGRLPLTLYWKAARKPTAEYQVEIVLTDEQGQPVMQHKADPANAFYPTTAWSAGEILRGWLDLAVPPTIQSGVYRIELRLLAADQETARVSLGDVEISGRPHSFTPPVIQNPSAYKLGNSIALLGYSLDRNRVYPGDSLDVTLFWQSLEQTERSYTVFVHLLGSDGRVWAQQDVPPGQGASPTTGWITGEYITDVYQLAVPPDAPIGRYQIEIGMYDPDTTIRLPVLDSQGQGKENRIMLPEQIEVQSR